MRDAATPPSSFCRFFCRKARAPRGSGLFDAGRTANFVLGNPLATRGFVDVAFKKANVTSRGAGTVCIDLTRTRWGAGGGISFAPRFRGLPRMPAFWLR